MEPSSHQLLNSALRYWGCAIQAGAQISGAFTFALPNASPELVDVVKTNFSPLPFACIPHLFSSTPPDWNQILLNSHSQDARQLLSVASEKSHIPPPVKFDPANRSITLLMPGFDKSEIKLYQVCPYCKFLIYCFSVCLCLFIFLLMFHFTRKRSFHYFTSIETLWTFYVIASTFCDYPFLYQLIRCWLCKFYAKLIRQWFFMMQFRGGSELLVEAGDQRRIIHLPSQLQGKVGGAKFSERSLVITMQ